MTSSHESDRLVLACSECGGKPRGLRYHDLPEWPDCRCGGTFQGSLGGVLYPNIVFARYDLDQAARREDKTP